MLMKLDDVIKFAERYESICIYGSGELGKSLFEALKYRNIAVSAFIVSDDQSIASDKVSEIPVLTLSSWRESVVTSRSGILVAVSKFYQADIINHLHKKGILDYLIVEKEALYESMRKLRPVKPEKFLTTIDPVSRGFGSERGKPIDRVYIERFLQSAAMDLQDATDILEVGSDDYSRKFFPDSVKPRRYRVLRYDQGMDLTNAETLPANRYDVFICTQVFNFIYDVKAAVKGAHYLLKPGGILLATVQGCVGQVSRTDMKLWGDYWRFTDLGFGKLIKEVFGEEKTKVYPYGNAFAATAFVQGLAMEDLSDLELLKPVESEYAICVGVIARKEG